MWAGALTPLTGKRGVATATIFRKALQASSGQVMASCSQYRSARGQRRTASRTD
jgi:hypothetical protein